MVENSTTDATGSTGSAVVGELAPGERWFVVQSRPHKEAFAATQLAMQGFRPFLPRLRKTVRHARRRRTVLAAVFPRYLFVALDLDRHRWRTVLGTFGVTTMIMDGERPRPVPPGVVEALGAVATPDGAIDFADRLAPGEPVRFLEGPFAEQIGRVLRLDAQGRVAVLLELLGGERVVTARAASLVPARD